VPTTKGRLLKAIAREVLDIAEAEGRNVGAIIEELRARKSSETTAAA